MKFLIALLTAALFSTTSFATSAQVSNVLTSGSNTTSVTVPKDDVPNQVTLFCNTATAGAQFYHGCVPADTNAAGPYQVPSGKTLHIYELDLASDTTSSGMSIGYSLTTFSVNTSVTVPTSPIYWGKADVYPFHAPTTVFAFQSYYFVGHFPQNAFPFIETSTANMYLIMLKGYLTTP